MESIAVVVELPAVDNPPGVFQANEQFTIQKLVTETAVEALHVSILPGTALGDKQRLHTGPTEPSRHSLALRSNGSLAAWGLDDDGQVSGPNGAGAGFTQVAGGYNHSLSLHSDGSLTAWGLDDYGQVSGPNGAGSGFMQVADGQRHSPRGALRRQPH